MCFPKKSKTKIKNEKELASIVSELRAKGKQVVFTNGCFDLIHPGHTTYLETAREKGDYLVVAINSDRSVREIKGDKRPILTQDERADVVSALSSVDFVIIFDELDPERLIASIVPNVLVKGADWPMESIIGRETVTRNGGHVFRIPLVPNSSTTNIVEKILKLYKSNQQKPTN